MRRYRIKVSRVKWLAIIGLAAPMGAQAEQVFNLPAGCTAYLTVQETSCSVDHHFRCEGDPAGTQRRVSLDEDRMTYMGQIDAEAQWLESYHPLSGHTEKLESNPAEPASLSDLIADNVDDYDFRTRSVEIGETRYVGRDTLTGKTVTIDGVTLDQTTFEITAFSPDGAFQWSSKGSEFISRDWRMFLSGTATIKNSSETFERDNTPVEFIFPGEAGFLSTKPKYGCGVMMSLAPELQEYSNDHI